MKKSTEEVIELPAEEIPNLRSVESAIKPDIIVFDKYQKRFEELKEQYGDVKINGIEDKEGYDKAKLAVRELRTTRTGSEKDRTSAKAFYLECGRAIDKKAEWIENAVLSLETPIKTQIQEVDAAKEKIRLDKEKAEAARLRVRDELLVSLGARCNGIDYISDELYFPLSAIKGAEEGAFNDTIVPQFKAIWETKEKIRIAHKEAEELAEKNRQEANREFERQQELLRQHQLKLKEQQDELDRKKNEEQEIIRLEEKKKTDDKLKTRLNQLVSLGLKFDFNAGYYVNYDVFIHTTDITGYDDQKWDDMIVGTTAHIEKLKAAEAEKETERIEKEKQDAIEKANAERERLAEEDRKRQRQELEESTDAERWVFFTKLLKGVELPVMQSRQYKAMTEDARTKIASILSNKATRSTK